MGYKWVVCYLVVWWSCFFGLSCFFSLALLVVLGRFGVFELVDLC